MVWTYECVGSALSEHVTPSEPTYLANESVGTLYNGTNVDTTTAQHTNKLAISTVSTVSTQFLATHSSISSIVTSNHPHLPSHDAMLTITAVLSRHTAHFSISTSFQCHSSFKPTVPAREQ